jgi:hypothetical protein
MAVERNELFPTASVGLGSKGDGEVHDLCRVYVPLLGPEGNLLGIIFVERKGPCSTPPTNFVEHAVLGFTSAESLLIQVAIYFTLIYDWLHIVG